MNNRTTDESHEDDALERRLRAGITRTRSTFEARFERIRYGPRSETAPDSETMIRWTFPNLMRWGGVGAAAAAVLIAAVLLFVPAPESGDSGVAVLMESEVYLEDPFYWDDALESAQLILDEEILDAILFYAYENDNI